MNPIRSLHGRARNAWRASLLAGLTCAGAALSRAETETDLPGWRAGYG